MSQLYYSFSMCYDLKSNENSNTFAMKMQYGAMVFAIDWPEKIVWTLIFLIK